MTRNHILCIFWVLCVYRNWGKVRMRENKKDACSQLISEQSFELIISSHCLNPRSFIFSFSIWDKLLVHLTVLCETESLVRIFVNVRKSDLFYDFILFCHLPKNYVFENIFLHTWMFFCVHSGLLQTLWKLFLLNHVVFMPITFSYSPQFSLTNKLIPTNCKIYL